MTGRAWVVHKSFETRTFGKWILAGEHAVLRGHPAIAFPLLSKNLNLSYVATEKALDVEFTGSSGAELKLLFYGVIENAMSRLGIKEGLKGRFRLESSLPVGAGLGASAALCGAVGRWCEAQGWVDKSDLYEFSRRLEDLFHGESSGVDLAVSLSAQGIRFVRGGEQSHVETSWSPQLYLSYCGQRGMTAECVGKVKRLFEDDLPLAEELDKQMHQAVDLAEMSLRLREDQGLVKMTEALRLGRDCFERWQLCDGDLKTHMHRLEKAGALAVKPTGSGGGGYVLSLWAPSINRNNLPDYLVPCFN
jgi:mevalonate kinase